MGPQAALRGRCVMVAIATSAHVCWIVSPDYLPFWNAKDTFTRSPLLSVAVQERNRAMRMARRKDRFPAEACCKYSDSATVFQVD